MLKVTKLGPIMEPTENSFESRAVLNPGIWQDGDTVHVFYRGINENYESEIGYARLNGPTTVVERFPEPVIHRTEPYESKGVEDPRIVKIGDEFYVTYVAHDGKNALTAYATSKDLKKFEKHGIITPLIPYHEIETYFQTENIKDMYSFFSSYYEHQAGSDVLLWSKDVFPFPKKFNGKYALVHRVLPDMQIIFFNNFSELQTETFWREQFQNLSQSVVLENKHWFESRSIGGGCPPFETDEGWVLIFHTSEARNIGRVYHACAALLDKENPLKVIGRLHEPLFSPTESWEKTGFVSDVIFPTGTAIFGDALYIYYGAADKRIAVAAVGLRELIAEMLDPAKKHGVKE